MGLAVKLCSHKSNSRADVVFVAKLVIKQRIASIIPIGKRKMTHNINLLDPTTADLKVNEIFVEAMATLRNIANDKAAFLAKKKGRNEDEVSLFATLCELTDEDDDDETDSSSLPELVSYDRSDEDSDETTGSLNEDV